MEENTQILPTEKDVRKLFISEISSIQLIKKDNIFFWLVELRKSRIGVRVIGTSTTPTTESVISPYETIEIDSTIEFGDGRTFILKETKGSLELHEAPKKEFKKKKKSRQAA